MSKKFGGLGRGLSELLPDLPEEEPVVTGDQGDPDGKRPQRLPAAKREVPS